MKLAAVFPGKYIQGEGVLADLGSIIKNLGAKKPMLIWGKRTRNAAGETVFAALKEYGLDYYEHHFGGECSFAESAKIEALVKENGCDIVVGLGGGKALDCSKAVANHTGLLNIIVPTAASSDAPTSACTVWYNEDGSFNSFELWPANPAVILVDTAVCITAPVHMFLAGVGDALATYIEAKACYATHAVACSGGRPTLTAMAMAKLCYDILIEYTEAAIIAIKAGHVTPAFEKVVEATTLLSGIGWESCGVATAHVLGNSLADFPEAHHHMHGEKVAMGIITQLMLDPDVDMEFTLKTVDFMIKVGLPVTFADLDLQDVSKERFYDWCVAQCYPGNNMEHHNFEVTPDTLFAAMMMADEFGKARKAALGK
ncbi:MAG: glycerol dehydrogenase [Christensenellales bacterium]|jgi:glycerol dehydrogenase